MFLLVPQSWNVLKKRKEIEFFMHAARTVYYHDVTECIKYN